MAVMVAAGIGAVSSLFGSRSARKAQREANRIAQAQLDFAKEQDAWVKNTLRPELQAEQERLREFADQYGGQMDDQYGYADDMRGYFTDRIETLQRPTEDALFAEALRAGGYEDQQQEAGRASADVRQANSMNMQQQMRMGRAYGGDLNKMLAAQADASPMAALAEAAAMSKARASAKNLGFDKRLAAANYGKTFYAGEDSAARRAIGTTEGGMSINSAPSKFALESARAITGASGMVGDIYGSAGRTAMGMADTAARTSASNTSGFGSFVGQNWKAISDRGSQLWNTYGFGSGSGSGAIDTSGLLPGGVGAQPY